MNQNQKQNLLNEVMGIMKDRGVEPYVRMEIRNSKYLIKTIDQPSEFEQVLLMRSKIFAEEYGVAGLEQEVDLDRFDFQCDHLIIKTIDSDELVGTYRLLCSRFTREFYSETEFELGEFLASPGIKLELGRACIKKEHRKGAVISLLWRGIVQYALETGADYLFGCSSVKTESYQASLDLNSQFETAGKLGKDWGITPKSNFKFNAAEKLRNEPESVEIPSLLQSYLGAGAKIYGDPAYDRDFHCLDYLTVLKLDELKSSFERRYRVEQSA